MLAFETATDHCSVALFHQGRVFERVAALPRTHAQTLLVMIDSVLTEAEISIKEVAALACGIGPGSFTGIRIGISVAQGLAFGASKPVCGVCTLEVMAHRLWRKTGARRILAKIDAQCQQWFAALYEVQETGIVHIVKAPCLVENTEIEVLKRQVEAEAHLENAWPKARDLALIAVQKNVSGCKSTVYDVAPLYIREEVAKKNEF